MAAKRQSPPTVAPVKGAKKQATDVFNLPERDAAVNGLLVLLAHLHHQKTRSIAGLLVSEAELAELPASALLNRAYAESRRHRRERRALRLSAQIAAVKLAIKVLGWQGEDINAA